MCALLSEGQELFSEFWLIVPFSSVINVMLISGELIELFDQDGYVDQVRKERLEAR